MAEATSPHNIGLVDGLVFVLLYFRQWVVTCMVIRSDVQTYRAVDLSWSMEVAWGLQFARCLLGQELGLSNLDWSRSHRSCL